MATDDIVRHFLEDSSAASSATIVSSSPTDTPQHESSTISIASSYSLRESLDAFNSSKRPLTDVKEELQDRDNDTKLDDNYSFDDTNTGRSSRVGSAASVSEAMSYSSYSTGHDNLDPSSQLRLHFKKQRSGDGHVSRSNSDMGNRFSSMCNRWRSRSGAGPKLSIETGQGRGTFSRSTSRSNSACSNVASPAWSILSKQEYTLPPSPARTLFEEPMSTPSLDIQNERSHEEEHVQASTPLLPPLLVNLSTRLEEPVQSPLQSPTIADTPILQTPSPICSPQLAMLPSPPLSSRPSIASMRQRSRAPTLVPASEIPAIQLREVPDDIWSQKLGHANYTITPEPYAAEDATLEAYQQFREDWDSARANYIKHLARTGEHYGTSSKIYKLTEEKWAVINGQWQSYNKFLSGRLDRHDAATLQSSPTRNEPTATATRLPVDDASSPGKFPKLGDEDIVGPMAVAPIARQPSDSLIPGQSGRKRSFFKFLADLLGRGTGLRT